MHKQETVGGMVVDRTRNERGETFVRISIPGFTHEAATVDKDQTIHAYPHIVWRPALVNYSARGGQPASEVLQFVAAISLACAIAAQLDAEFPAGSICRSPEEIAA
jgi:hypothetical protein